MDALANWLTIAVVFATQGALVAALVVLMGALVIPEHPLIVDCVKFLKGML